MIMVLVIYVKMIAIALAAQTRVDRFVLSTVPPLEALDQIKVFADLTTLVLLKAKPVDLVVIVAVD